MPCIAIIGAPNVGKSSILNALVGETVGIVTDLAGTTRDQIRGFVDDLTIIDTPGMHGGTTILHKHMRKSVSHAVQSADILLYVLDATKFTTAEVQKIANYRDKLPVIVAVNKTDKTKMENLYPKLQELNKLDFVKSIVPMSAKTHFNLDVLLKKIKLVSSSVEGNARGGVGGNAPQTDPDLFTDQSIKSMSTEIIRANVIKNTRDEIPHGIAVVITKWHETPSTTEIHADILCLKESHKPIIIGKGGQNLKKIGTNARIEIEKLTETKVKLYTTVIVRPNWKDSREVVNSPYL